MVGFMKMVSQLRQGGPGSALRLVTLSRIQLTLSSLVTEVEKPHQSPLQVGLNFPSFPMCLTCPMLPLPPLSPVGSNFVSISRKTSLGKNPQSFALRYLVFVVAFLGSGSYYCGSG